MTLKVKVSGTVQGVGFRPFVYKVATELRLKGFVRNVGGEVEIALDGPEQSLNEFLRRLRKEAPALAVIDKVDVQPEAGEQEDFSEFVILHSKHGESGFQTVPPDTATCELCLEDMLDRSNRRRFNYPFTNCTACGPRFTIIKELPYDRRSTTMAEFKMCSACRDEYDDPTNRRFHAQPNACWKCGPQIWFATRGVNLPERRMAPDVQLVHLDEFVSLIAHGGIGALKGLGGFHLICDATNSEAVSALRSRKKRNDKPFAVMFRDIEQAQRYVEIDETAARLLSGQRRPIVLLPAKKADLSPLIAPGMAILGAMLPYTPLHHLLLARTTKPLVMTSGNFAEEPICMDNEEAFSRLSTIADGFLLNDRNIETRFDDSVMKRDRGETIFIRRSRGFAPEPLTLAGTIDGCILGVGAELKNTFCFGKDNHAFLSQHIGDLDDVSANEFFEQALKTYGGLFGLEAEVIVHDMHPDYLSTRVARELASSKNLPIHGIQHHHAHIASCMIDNGLNQQVIGLALDGTGYGDDGTIWGGEVLIANYEGYERAGHFAQVQMPGMDAAIRQPGRMLAAYATKLHSDFIERRLQEILQSNQLNVIRQQLEKNLNSCLTSSCGRLFDAVAALLGVCTHPTFEGQPAMKLEAIAQPSSHRMEIPARDDHIIDGFATVDAAAKMAERGVEASYIAYAFHDLIARELAAICKDLHRELGIDAVCLSGGVMQNSLLLSLLTEQLQRDNLKVYKQRQVPPNDGGISLGQVIVGAAMSGKWSMD